MIIIESVAYLLPRPSNKREKFGIKEACQRAKNVQEGDATVYHIAAVFARTIFIAM